MCIKAYVKVVLFVFPSSLPSYFLPLSFLASK